ncbi:MAG: hypothetical protein A2378_01875 [Candidatus Pacebacteria bacterium RIFOXYB1_FULL_44_10]|nr:MAG: hypothetical protein A2378_01875 [Candidatus Pacebacteria bacterium RIFOXYB1_FULL_44_10]
MNISSILITGDDGYTSPRTRLLIRLLKDTYDLRVCATNTQQSGVGGYMSIREGGVWGEDAVDGVPALWVDKHPVDAIEVAEMYYQRTFDLVISGVNWGANLGGSVISSGTFAAGYRALHDRLAPHVMVLSWKVPFEMWFAIDQQETPIDSFL